MITDLRALAQALGGEVSNGQVLAPGPGHSPKDRSLSVKLDSSASDGFLTHSFAGDDAIICRDHVRSKAGLPAFKPNGKCHRASEDAIERALMAAVQSSGKPKGKIIAIYDYKDADGALLYQNVRYEPKDFRQRRPDGNGGHIWNLRGVDRRVPYRWRQLIDDAYAPVCFTEGEKDADTLAAIDLCSTTIVSGKWTDEIAQALKDRNIWIFEDADESGRKRALEAAKRLHAVATSIKVIRLPGLTGGEKRKDVTDWLDELGHTKDELLRVVEDTPDWSPEESASDSDAQDEAAAVEQPKDALIQSSGEFIAAYEPPDYLIDGLLQRRFCYSLTAHTGRGKTALALLIAAHVALGRTLAGRDVEQGRVLMFAGENPTDVRQRWIAMSQQMDFDADTIEVCFIPGRFKISALIKRIRTEVEALGGLSLLIIDTSAAYFEGDDENSNVQLGRHASQMRELRLPGGPTTIINCHPTKNATDDNLLPRGAGAFLAEVDGNLTLKLDDTAIEMHWQGKFRGADFAPISFELCTVTHERLRLISTVIAKPLSDAAQEELAQAIRFEEDQLLRIIETNPKASIAELAKVAGWLNAKFEPLKAKAQRTVNRLKKAKLIAVERGEYLISEKGAKLLKKLKEKSQ